MYKNLNEELKCDAYFSNEIIEVIPDEIRIFMVWVVLGTLESNFLSVSLSLLYLNSKIQWNGENINSAVFLWGGPSENIGRSKR